MATEDDTVGLDELQELITDSWRLKAPKRLRTAFDASSALPDG